MFNSLKSTLFGSSSSQTIVESSTTSNQYTLPKLIHFIWAGGDKPMPLPEMRVVAEWAKKYPNWKIYLWIDKATVSSIEDLTKYYLQFFRSQQLNDFYNLDAQNDSTTAGIFLKDISEIGLDQETQACVRYEIDNLVPNYGSSSDVLRTGILVKYGGGYFDSDVPPGDADLSKAAEYIQNARQHVLFVDHLTQAVNPDIKQVREFTTDHIGNDVFICSPNNPLMVRLLKQTIVSYNLDPSDIENILHRAYGGTNLRDITLKTTGPVKVREILLSSNLQKTSESDWLNSKENVVLKRVRTVENGHIVSFINPKGNNLNWLKPKLNKYDDVDTVIFKISNTIIFEARYFKCLRLDDHIDQLLASFVGELSKDAAINRLIDLISKNPYLDYLKSVGLQHIQITGKYDNTTEIRSLCDKNNLTCLFGLKEDNLMQALKYNTYWIDIVDLMHKVNQDKTASTPNYHELASLSKDVKIRYVNYISIGVELITNLIPHLKLFQDRANILGILNDILDDYKKVIEPLSVTLPETHIQIKLDSLIAILQEKQLNRASLRS